MRDYVSKFTKIENNRRYKSLSFRLHMSMPGLHMHTYMCAHICATIHIHIHMHTHTLTNPHTHIYIKF